MTMMKAVYPYLSLTILDVHVDFVLCLLCWIQRESQHKLDADSKAGKRGSEEDRRKRGDVLRF